MYSAGFFFFLLLLLLAAFNCNAEPETQDCQASCGTLANISYPFGLEHSSKTGCPKSRYNLKCKSNRAIFYFNERPYYVMNISYEEGSMWLIDSVLQRDNCSSLLSYGSSFSQGDNSGEEFYLPYYADRVVYVNCLVPVKDPAYVPAAPCSLSSSPPYLYAILSNYSMSIRRLNTSCKVVMSIPASFADNETATTHSQIVSILMRGFQVQWPYSGSCSSKWHQCKFLLDSFPLCPELFTWKTLWDLLFSNHEIPCFGRNPSPFSHSNKMFSPLILQPRNVYF